MLKLENHITKLWPKELHTLAERALLDDISNKRIIRNINKRLISTVLANIFSYLFLLVALLASFELTLFMQVVLVILFAFASYIFPKHEIEKFLNKIVFPLNRGNRIPGKLEAVNKITTNNGLLHLGWRIFYSVNNSHYPLVIKLSVVKQDCSGIYQKGDPIVVFVDDKNPGNSCPGLHELIEQFKFLK